MDYLTYRWTNIELLFYTNYISVDLADHKIFHAKVGKGGINTAMRRHKTIFQTVSPQMKSFNTVT